MPPTSQWPALRLAAMPPRAISPVWESAPSTTLDVRATRTNWSARSKRSTAVEIGVRTTLQLSGRRGLDTRPQCPAWRGAARKTGPAGLPWGIGPAQERESEAPEPASSRPRPVAAAAPLRRTPPARGLPSSAGPQASSFPSGHHSPPSSRALPAAGALEPGCTALESPHPVAGTGNNSRQALASAPPASAPGSAMAGLPSRTGVLNWPWPGSVAAPTRTRWAPPWPRSWPVAGVRPARRRQQRKHLQRSARAMGASDGPGLGRSLPARGGLQADRGRAGFAAVGSAHQPRTAAGGLAGSRLRELAAPGFLLCSGTPQPGLGGTGAGRGGSCRKPPASASTGGSTLRSAPAEGVWQGDSRPAGNAARDQEGRQCPSHPRPMAHLFCPAGLSPRAPAGEICWVGLAGQLRSPGAAPAPGGLRATSCRVAGAGNSPARAAAAHGLPPTGWGLPCSCPQGGLAGRSATTLSGAERLSCFKFGSATKLPLCLSTHAAADSTRRRAALLVD